MTRVIAGVAGGRRLRTPEGRDTRPTSDRAREGLFSTVQALLGSLEGVRAVDLFAGSGAVGLEALSRGAAHALLVESHPKAARVIRENIDVLGLPGARLVTDRVERLVRTAPEASYDFVFADPPYAVPDETVVEILEGLRDNGWLSDGALVAVERASRGPALKWPEGYVPERDRKYGEAVFHYASFEHSA
ncbi:16S rRNA (guanine(966)-N(2))-methyltransferase RsmD [Actinocorallia sp. A-T 12471]|uniref:16S rRNA (guanine(966)-N(2))-methyltransferase RsmD n=1 Tax=Actinocorallia sp. A-T 12471 TaxID=3089813 RepID=UPI0029CD7332|nr:16S rRNA (guanine(966)-N(2))-methyltransferase RsmD [Actinocorallia sp. A-T 12471]MDX6739096.1 16S rRNA (guanine(966)-N(2))-methyltransferase RsmD [Actinocorallia sp. A-T 12471]